MIATNHAMTGAIIGLTIANPIVAIPVALLSHFILDALPHFDTGVEEKKLFKSNGWRNYLIIEATLCFLLVCILAVKQPVNWQLGALCAFVAASPDLLSINHWLKVKAGKEWKPNVYSRFAHKIQWFTKPIGGWVEAAWALSCILILAKLI